MLYDTEIVKSEIIESTNLEVIRDALKSILFVPDKNVRVHVINELIKVKRIIL